MTFNAQRNDNITLQLLRYEALFKLIDDINGQDDITAIARQVSTQWKYFANVADWRMVIGFDKQFRIIDGSTGQATLTEQTVLPEWDARNWRLCCPKLLDVPAAGAPADVPATLIGPATAQILVIPFTRDEQTIGLLSVSSRHEPFNELDKKFIRLCGRHLADYLSMLLIRQKATRMLTDQATHDALTQLLNRGTIIAELTNKLALAKRTGQPLSLIMLDLDYFKQVNDRYGHLAGDEVLCDVSARLLEQTRDGDSLGRYGGEEFLVVLYPCNEAEVALAAERLRLAIEQQPTLLGGCAANPVNLTISLGTTCSGGQDTVRVEHLLKQADEALYRAKALGRNCTTAHARLGAA